MLSSFGSDGGVLFCESLGEHVQCVDESGLEWKDVSEYASLAVVPRVQLVRCRIRAAVQMFPRTLKELLSVQPASKPLVRDARNPRHATTYGQMLEFVSAGGLGSLQQQGVRKGEVVVYCVPGGSALGAVTFIAIASQTTAAPLDPAVTEKDAASALDQFGAKHVILFEGLPCAGLAAAARADPNVCVHEAALVGDESPGLFKFVSRGVAGAAECATFPEDVALLLRTSGTTSKPKCVPLRQGQLIQNALLLSGSLQLRESDVTLNVMPLFHIGGLSASILATLVVGAQ
jgi:acyl-coenzyme A synthetase/AMP-(fatty) acid ligase